MAQRTYGDLDKTERAHWDEYQTLERDLGLARLRRRPGGAQGGRSQVACRTSQADLAPCPAQEQGRRWQRLEACQPA